MLEARDKTTGEVVGKVDAESIAVKEHNSNPDSSTYLLPKRRFNWWAVACVGVIVVVWFNGWREVRTTRVEETPAGFTVQYDYHWQFMAWDLPTHRSEDQLGNDPEIVSGGVEVTQPKNLKYRNGRILWPKGEPNHVSVD